MQRNVSLPANLVHHLDSLERSYLTDFRHRRYHDEDQMQLAEWPTSLQLDFAALERKVVALATNPLYAQKAMFAHRLRQHDKALYYKWLYEGHMTHTERDTLLVIANGVRADS